MIRWLINFKIAANQNMFTWPNDYFSSKIPQILKCCLGVGDKMILFPEHTKKKRQNVYTAGRYSSLSEILRFEKKKTLFGHYDSSYISFAGRKRDKFLVIDLVGDNIENTLGLIGRKQRHKNWKITRQEDILDFL